MGGWGANLSANNIWLDWQNAFKACRCSAHTHIYGLISAKELINKTLGFHQNWSTNFLDGLYHTTSHNISSAKSAQESTSSMNSIKTSSLMTRVVEDTQQTCQSKYPDPLTQLLCHGSYAQRPKLRWPSAVKNIQNTTKEFLRQQWLKSCISIETRRCR